MGLAELTIDSRHDKILICANQLRLTFALLSKVNVEQKKKQECNVISSICKTTILRWPVPINMRVGYVFDSRFSE